MSEQYEYKVIDVRDKFGKVNVDKLTDILNEYGREGWHLVTAYTNEIGKNVLAASGIGINSSVDQNILIMERKISTGNSSTTNNSNVEQQVSLTDKKHESFSWLQDEKNKETVKEYITAQLEKTDMSDIYKFQQLYFGTSSLAYMKEFVADVTGYTSIEEYKAALQKLLKDL